jgi:Cu2+-exporting ATPase
MKKASPIQTEEVVEVASEGKSGEDLPSNGKNQISLEEAQAISRRPRRNGKNGTPKPAAQLDLDSKYVRLAEVKPIARKLRRNVAEVPVDAHALVSNRPVEGDISSIVDEAKALVAAHVSAGSLPERKGRSYPFDVKLIAEGYMRIFLHAPASEPVGEAAAWILGRVFRQECVQWAEVNGSTRTVLVCHTGEFNPAQLDDEKGRPADIPRMFLDAPFKKLKFNRRGGKVTHWEIVHEVEDQFRAHHPYLLRRPVLCTRIERALKNPSTGNVLVDYEPEKVAKEKIIDLMDSYVMNPSPEESKQEIMELGRFEYCTAGFAWSLLLPQFIIVTLPVVLACSTPIFLGATQAVKNKKIKVDILDTVVIAGTILANQLAISAFMAWIVALADKIHQKTQKTTGKLLGDIFGSQPRFAWIKENGKEKQVAVVDLKKGDIIIVHSGEAIPSDGFVAFGEGLVDQSALTGESQPSEKTTGSPAYSCTTLVSGELNIRVEKTGTDTIAGQIQKVITDTANYKTKVQSMGEAIADKAVLPTLGLGALAFTTGGPSAALAVINCDFGTGIRVAAPTLLLSHLITLARKGILVKNGEALDKIRKVDVFIFDKTGTLTMEVPEVVDVIPLAKGFDKDQILVYAASAEQFVSHPIAKAILARAAASNLKLMPRENAKSQIGLGVEVKLGGKNIKVGSVKYMEKERIPVSKQAAEDLERIKEAGQGTVMVAVNNLLAGVVTLNTTPRSDAFEIIQYLKDQGVKETVLISGDQTHVTRAIAKELGVEKFHAEVLPHQKADYVRKYKNEGKIVAMVGDGVNDGPALCTADVSISLSGATEIAMDTAQVVFLDGNFSKISSLFDASKKFNKGVWQSFRLIAIPNSLCIAGAMVNLWGLGMSLLCNNAFNLIATLKSLSPLWELDSKAKKEPAKA